MKPGSVLLVEDDPLIACQITSVIEELGHTAIVVQEPRAALRLLQDDEPDVIILSSYCSVERSRNMVLLLKYLLQGKTGMLLLTGARRKDMNEAWPSGERFSMLFKPFTIHQIKEQLLRLLKRDIACSIQSS
jgi:DNA-binding response OmpR family regulator